MVNIKALSLIQPWASLIMDGRKTIETRSWATKYRGPLAIHASLKLDKEAAKQFGYLLAIPARLVIANLPFLLPRGAVLGIAILKGCVQFPNTLAPPDPYGDFTPGRFGWLFMNAKAFEHPIPAKGHLGLWEWEGMP